MKGNAIVRIVLFSLAILILAGILIGGIAARLFFRNIEDFTTVIKEKINVGEPEIVAEYHINDISVIEIKWVSGDIRIVGGASDNQVIISESSLDKDDYKMVYKHYGSKLTIEYCTQKNNFMGINAPLSKDLVITVPRGWLCDSLEIETASSDIYFNDFKIRELDIESASGKCEFVYCDVVDLDIDTASGDIFFDGNLCNLELDAASAKAEFIISGLPQTINADMASGDLVFVLPDDQGFRLDVDVASGELINEFPADHNSHYTSKEMCRIRVSALSGDVIIMPHCKYTGHH